MLTVYYFLAPSMWDSFALVWDSSPVWPIGTGGSGEHGTVRRMNLIPVPPARSSAPAEDVKPGQVGKIPLDR
jgi:hypothetical protein